LEFGTELVPAADGSLVARVVAAAEGARTNNLNGLGVKPLLSTALAQLGFSGNCQKACATGAAAPRVMSCTPRVETPAGSKGLKSHTAERAINLQRWRRSRRVRGGKHDKKI
jgi:hypothetical protein